MKEWKEDWRKRLDYMRVSALMRRDYDRAYKYTIAIESLQGI
jgi:hypothetical protein